MGSFDGTANYNNEWSAMLIFNQFNALCCDPTQPISIGETVTFTVQDPGTVPNFQVLAELVTEYNASSMDALNTEGAQWAVWKVITDGIDSPSFSSGLVRLDPTETTVSNLALSYIQNAGNFSPAPITVLANPTAPFRADTDRPTFYFYFNQPGSGLYQNGLGMLRMPGPAPSPALFSLLHFQVAGGAREALTQQLGFIGSDHRAVDKALVAFSYAELFPGVFKVTADTDLEPGEYAFVYTPTDQSDGEDGEARYFDFSAPTP